MIVSAIAKFNTFGKTVIKSNNCVNLKGCASCVKPGENISVKSDKVYKR